MLPVISHRCLLPWATCFIFICWRWKQLFLKRIKYYIIFQNVWHRFLVIRQLPIIIKHRCTWPRWITQAETILNTFSTNVNTQRIRIVTTLCCQHAWIGGGDVNTLRSQLIHYKKSVFDIRAFEIEARAKIHFPKINLPTFLFWNFQLISCLW